MATLVACSRTTSTGGPASAGGLISPTSDAVRAAEAARRKAGQQTVTATLNPRKVTLDLGGPTVNTWAYGDTVPGPLLRARTGDLLKVTVANDTPMHTSIHWHGVALRNDMDGVPGLTQQPIPSAGSFTYAFTVPDPGTYFYHPHDIQLDRGLYGVLVVDDPHEPGRYDQEWILVLDDWTDGVKGSGRTPDQVLAGLTAATSTSGSGTSTGGMDGMDGMGMDGMNGMGMGSMGEGAQSPILGGAGDVVYPYYLANGRIPDAPYTFTAKPRQKARIRIVNAGSDTAFRVALTGHELTVTHTDGYPVVPVTTDALIVGMGERYDLEVTLADGLFPLVALAEGKEGEALAMVRTGSGTPPKPPFQPKELDRRVLVGSTLTAAESARLTSKSPDRTHTLDLGGTMSPYVWTINGKSYPNTAPLIVRQGERVRLRMVNRTMMFHPLHVHGHTFALTGTGARKDTVIVKPMQTLEVDLDATNPGQWMAHCHNIYHAERGMIVPLSYRG
jgi:FtsP/CotA-like multicopper oxidase with cupredoxin domain